MAPPPQAPDPKVYYGYLFNPDKTPTDTLEALLRAIANHIIAEIGDKNETHLTPAKLAAFYREAGGNYDRLFLEMPPSTVSYIWSNIGCQHSLQPTDDNHAPPSIPALTMRGFVRWKAVEILLDPAVHVPFIQHAVQHWNLKRPDTGEPFPAPLPASAFPTEPDAKMVNWHEEKLEALRAEAEDDGTKGDRPTEDAPREDGQRAEREEERAPPTRRPSSPRETRPPPRRRSPHGHSPMSSPRRSSPRRAGPMRAGDSSGEESLRGRRQERRRGGLADPAGGGVHYVYPGRAGVRRPADIPFSFQTVEEEERPRRRSFSGHPSPTDRRRSPEFSRKQQQQQQHRQQSRDYRQPRARSPVIVSSDTESPSPRMRSRAEQYRSESALNMMRGGGGGGGRRPSVRHVVPGYASPSRGHSPGLRPPPPPMSESGERRKSAPADGNGMREKVMNAVSSILYSGGGKAASERQRSSSRTNSHTSGGYLRPDEYAPRREDVDSDDSDDSERERRRRRRRELDRERERVEMVQRARERERERDRDRDRDRERDRSRDRDRMERHPDVFEDRPLRPPPRKGSPHRRTAPHGGLGSRRGSWDEYDGSRERATRPERRRRDPHSYRD